MRTTLNLDDGLYRQAKVKAVLENRTVSQLIEDGLRRVLAETASGNAPGPRATLPFIHGGHPASAGEEITPEKAAQILANQDSDWVGRQ